MNTQLVISFGLGVGIAGFLYSFSLAPEKLSNRIRPIRSKSRFAKKLPEAIPVLRSISIGKSKNVARIQKAIFELPEILDLLSVSLSSGEGIYRALSEVAPRAKGVLPAELQKILKAVDLGAPLATEIEKLPNSLPHQLFSELANKISMSLTRGTPLASMLTELSQSARSEIRIRLIRQAGKNETRMLIPLVFLILPVTVLFAVYPSLRLLNFNYF